MDEMTAAMDLAAQQHALITESQLRALEWSTDQIYRRCRSGMFVRSHLTVYRLSGAPETRSQQLLAACLAIGPEAAVSHRCAAALHGLWRDADGPVEVTSARWRSPELTGVVVHRLRDLGRSWVVRIDGVPVTTPARTLVDAGAVMPLGTVGRMYDRATGRKLTTHREIRAAMDAVARRGRAGVGVIRRLLDERCGEPPPAGVLEARMATLLRLHGVAPLVAEHTILDDHGQFVGIVDFADPELRLVVEVDGFEAHSALRQFRHDRVRQNQLVALGHRVLRFVWEEVDALSPRVAATISETRRQILGTLARA